MSIRLKLNIIFVAAAFIVLASGALVNIALESSAAAKAEMESRRQLQQLALELESSMSSAIADLRIYLASFTQGRPVSPESISRLIDLSEALAKRAKGEQETAIIGTLAQSVRGYLRSAERAEFYKRKSQNSKALNNIRPWIENELTPQLRSKVASLVKFQEQLLQLAIEREDNARQFATILTVIVMVMFVLLAVAMFYSLRRWFVYPMESLLRSARMMSRGEYQGCDLVQRVDEFGKLANEFDVLAERLSQTQEELVEKERLAAMGEMTFAVAHNLRNPLASMRALAQGSRHETTHQPQLDKSLKAIMDAVDRADRWLKELFASSRPVRIAAGRHELGEILRELVDGLAGFADQKNIALSLAIPKEPLHLTLDRARMQQALISFITNAIEASAEGQTVRLSCRAVSSEVEIEIVDDGIGMDASERSRMFVPYVSSKPGGTGLGLSLAQRIVYGHGGRLYVETSPGKGCRIRITLSKRMENGTPLKIKEAVDGNHLGR